MKTIYKYATPASENHLDVPHVVRPLHAGLDPATRTLAVWLLVDTDAPRQTFKVYVHGTGWPLEDAEMYEQYLDTVEDGAYIWHVFTEPV